jgi:hypothetical protein
LPRKATSISPSAHGESSILQRVSHTSIISAPHRRFNLSLASGTLLGPRSYTEHAPTRAWHSSVSMWLTRVVSSAIFLFAVVLSVPVAFDVGGRTCGLAFSLSLSSFYFIYSILRLATPNRSRFRYALVQVIGLTQWLVLPSLLIWSLNRFSVDGGASGGWVERTFKAKGAKHKSTGNWMFGPGGFAESTAIGSWDNVLRYSTPFFQLVEGFCSLLVIQAAGQISRWLVNRGRSDTWMVSSFCASSAPILMMIDSPTGAVRLHHLELRLFPVADHQVPRNWQC